MDQATPPAQPPEVSERPTREGWVPPLETEAQRREALEAAFDYRGDVTITTTDGRTIEGYIFDRRADGPEPHARVMLASGEKVKLGYGEIARLAFSGRDTASGKSWETWVRKYVEKKTRGESATLEPGE